MSTVQLPLIEPQRLDFKLSRRQSVLTNYDPSAYPPDLDLAKDHALSQRIGQYIPPKEDVDRCKCCLQPIHKNKLPIKSHLHEFLHIGAAYPLYFYFIKQCIVLLLINILLSSIPSLVINLTKGDMCEQLDGLVYNFYGYICKSSVVNIMNVQEIDMMEVQAIINFVTIIVSIIVIGIMDLDMRKKYSQYSQQYILPNASDYSVMIKGLPKDVTLVQVQKFLQDKLLYSGAPDTAVLKIYLIYNLKTYNTLYANKRSLVQEIATLQLQHYELSQLINTMNRSEERQNFIKNAQNILENINELENKKQLIEIEINNYEESFMQIGRQLRNQKAIESVQTNFNNFQLKFSGKCIITLNQKQSRDLLVGNTMNQYFLQRLGYYVGQFLGSNKGTLLITQAPQPSDIIFSNIGSQKLKMWKDWVWVTFVLTFLILLDFFLLTLSKKFVKEEKAINKQNLIFSFMNSQLIALFNSIVSKVIRYYENKTQMHSTQSSYYYSVTSKLVILFLINMLVTTFFSNLVTFYLINEKSRTFDKFPLNFQDYLFDVFFLLITNPFISIFLIFFDHRQGYKYYKRYRIQRGLPVTQAEANLDYENMQIDLSNKYGNIYRFILFAAGICFIYPPALIISVLSITAFYWLDKYLLLRRYVTPHKAGFRLTIQLQKIMWLYPLLLAWTNLVIMYVPIRDGTAFENGEYSKIYYYLAWLAVAASLIIYLGGCNWVLNVLKAFNICSSQKISRKPTYKQVQTDIEEDYWHHYPYFKINQNKKQIKFDSESEQEEGSPRRSKILQMRQRMGLNIFSVIKAHLHHDRYSPIV